MKTTIDIADSLFLQAKRIASEHSTTFKEIVETALRHFFEQEKTRASSFELRDASVGGDGVHAGVQEGDWNRASPSSGQPIEISPVSLD